ncbi:MAG TPA: lyase family protein, partial [Acidimicrobiales bacterium]|nr:lyase family protein [Acidimicrobiales bacterium]
MAISPLDGRYAAQLTDVDAALSDEALLRHRFAVEVGWLRTLAGRPEIVELPPLSDAVESALGAWVADFGSQDVAAIKELEAVTNHDVKAVEYYLKARLRSVGVEEAHVEFVHFACTSEDINNLAYACLLRDALHDVWLPAADGLVGAVAQLASAHAALPMPAHTHGQPATPTTLGKELAVFVGRWRHHLDAFRGFRPAGKLNGATGTFGAHVVAYPEVPWLEVSRSFVEGLGLTWNPLTTQIEGHDTMSEAFHLLVRFNCVLLDFCRDLWEYVSRGYLRQRRVAGEIGSSTMPHKVNP